MFVRLSVGKTESLATELYVAFVARTTRANALQVRSVVVSIVTIDESNELAIGAEIWMALQERATPPNTESPPVRRPTITMNQRLRLKSPVRMHDYCSSIIYDSCGGS